VHLPALLLLLLLLLLIIILPELLLLLLHAAASTAAAAAAPASEPATSTAPAVDECCRGQHCCCSCCSCSPFALSIGSTNTCRLASAAALSALLDPASDRTAMLSCTDATTAATTAVHVRKPQLLYLSLNQVHAALQQLVCLALRCRCMVTTPCHAAPSSGQCANNCVVSCIDS
jgi:hypothetical protein